MKNANSKFPYALPPLGVQPRLFDVIFAVGNETTDGH